MATTIIGVQQSVAAAGDAFTPAVTNGKHNIFGLNVGAYGVATGANAKGLVLSGLGTWNAFIEGSLIAESRGIFLEANTGTMTSGIEIGDIGSVYGTEFGIDIGGAAGGSNSNTGILNKAGGAIGADLTTGTAIRFNTTGGTHSVDNYGTIFAKDAIVATVGAKVTVNNSGEITGHVTLQASDNRLTNKSLLTGDILASNKFKLNNTGTIAGTVSGSQGVDDVENGGQITGRIKLAGMANGLGDNKFVNLAKGVVGTDVDGLSYIGDGGVDIVDNKGTLVGGVHLSDGLNQLTNSGSIGADTPNSVSIYGGITIDKITNSKSIMGGVRLFDGEDRFTNTGHVAGAVDMGDQKDIFYNYKMSGKTMVSGTLAQAIQLGAGDDFFYGGNNAETAVDGDGLDTFKFGGGNDFYIAVGATNDGTDTIDGGAGVDFYSAALATNAVSINLGPTIVGPDGMAYGTDISGSSIGETVDILRSIESASGGSHNDSLFGSAVANTLQGRGGNDLLVGNGGDDTLEGGDGTDTLRGGAGKDTLVGGADADTFIFAATSDSTVAGKGRDIIMDFVQGEDKIDLSLISTNTVMSDFVFFHGTNVMWDHNGNTGPGQLRAYWTATGQIIEGDIDGDRKADFSIELRDPTHSITLTAADFIL